MHYWLKGFVLSLISALIWPFIPTVVVTGGLGLLSVALALFITYYKTKPYVRGLVLFCSGGCAGIVVMACTILPTAYWSAQLQLTGAEHSIKARVLTLQHTDPNQISLNIQLLMLDGKSLNSWLAPVIRLSWYRPEQHLQLGDKLHARVKLTPAYGAMNLAAFNYQRWLWSEGVGAKGTLKKLISVTPGEALRARWFDAIAADFSLKRFTQQAAMLALTFGYRDFSDQFWQLLRQLGLTHLFAISGLHIGLAAAAGYLLGHVMLSGWFRYANWLSWRKMTGRPGVDYSTLQLVAPMLISYLVAMGYAALAGFSITTLRALLALTLLYLVRLAKFPLTRTDLYLGCVALLLFISPLAILSAGFWLSITAVGVIMLTLWRFPVRGSQRSIWSGCLVLLRLQLLFLVLMMPLQLYFFSGISYLAPLANLLAIPLFSFLIVPGLLLSVCAYLLWPSAGLVLFSAINWVLDRFWWLLHRLVEWEQLLGWGGWLEVNANWLPLILVTLFIGLLLQLPLFNRLQRFGVCTLLIGGLLLHWREPLSAAEQQQQDWQVVVFDVGQGLAVMVERQGHYLLYDTGAAYSSGFNWIETAILPYLLSRQPSFIVSEKPLLDYVIISHSDIDHSGGIAQLKANVAINKIISGEPDLINGTACVYQQFDWLGLAVVMFPGISEPERGSNNGRNNNNYSCSVKISDGYNSLLLPGDVEQLQELRLGELYQHQLAASVLIAPHHGSRTSSSAQFIELVAPDWVIYSAGFNNRYGFPHQQVVQRYKKQGVSQLSTATKGQIIIHYIPEQELQIKTYRDDLAPWWYNQQDIWPGWL